jgi:antitoxin component of MazEF toxin-antitoxin module
MAGKPMISHHARRIMTVGSSMCVTIPPHVMDHLHAQKGDFLVWDLNVRKFAVLSVAPVPPYDEPHNPESAAPPDP